MKNVYKSSEVKYDINTHKLNDTDKKLIEKLNELRQITSILANNNPNDIIIKINECTLNDKINTDKLIIMLLNELFNEFEKILKEN